MKSRHGYYLYAVIDERNGRHYHITEFFPEDAQRNEAGEPEIPDRTLKAFDTGLARLMTTAETVVSLEMNNYLKMVTAFRQLKTGFVVTEAAEGYSFETIMAKKKTPFTIHEATPVFLELLKAVAEAAQQHLFFYINPATVSVTAEGRLRLHYFYAHEYNEQRAAADIARFYYYMLSGSPPGRGPTPIKTDGLPENHQALIRTLAEQCRDETYESLQSLYEDLARIYSNKKRRAQRAAAEKTTEKTTEKTIEEKNGISGKTIAVIAAILIGFTAVTAAVSFTVATLIFGDPAAQRQSQSQSQNDPPTDDLELQ